MAGTTKSPLNGVRLVVHVGDLPGLDMSERGKAGTRRICEYSRFQSTQPGAGNVKNVPNGMRLVLPIVDLPALERPERAEAVTRGTREYPGFSVMLALCGNHEKRVEWGETYAIRCRFISTGKARKGKGRNASDLRIFCIFSYFSPWQEA